MTRTLILIAGVGFLMALVCLGAAAALGGREMAEHGWIIDSKALPGGVHFTIDSDTDKASGAGDGGGPEVTREIAWSGGHALDLEVPADLRFTQSPGPARLIITGPKGTVDQLQLSGSDLDFDEKPANARRVTIVMTAPDIRHFTLESDGVTSITGLDQDKLDLELNGANQLTVQGKVRAVKLDLSGDGKADLAALAAREAQVEIDGSGHATIAPTEKADLDISGDGEIDLTTHPAVMHSEVSGVGRIVQSAPAPTSPPR
jgi:hypothetical protein